MDASSEDRRMLITAVLNERKRIAEMNRRKKNKWVVKKSVCALSVDEYICPQCGASTYINQSPTKRYPLDNYKCDGCGNVGYFDRWVCPHCGGAVNYGYGLCPQCGIVYDEHMIKKWPAGEGEAPVEAGADRVC